MFGLGIFELFQDSWKFDRLSFVERKEKESGNRYKKMCGCAATVRVHLYEFGIATLELEERPILEYGLSGLIKSDLTN